MNSILSQISNYILPCIIIFIIIIGVKKRINIFKTFFDGAKEGFKTSINIIPYLTAIIVSIGMFRASGAIETISNILKVPLSHFNIPTEVLPIMIIRSLSGSANLGILSDIANNVGANTYAAKLAAIMVGSSETTFYVLAVYFGAVGIKRIRYSLITGIMADLTGIIIAVFVASYFFL